MADCIKQQLSFDDAVEALYAPHAGPPGHREAGPDDGDPEESTTAHAYPTS